MSKNPFLGLGFKSSFTSFSRPSGVISGINCSDLPAGQYLDLTSVKTFNITNEETTPRGVFVGDDGNKMFTTGAQGDGVDQYSLSTAWDPSTATFDKFLNIPQVPTAEDLFFSSDGTKVYVLDDFYDRVNMFNLTTPWDLASTNYNAQYFALGTNNSVLNPTGLTFSSDGVYMYVLSSYLRYMNRYTLSTPWDVTTAGSRQQSQFFSSQITSTGQSTGIAINDDGTRFVIIHAQGHEMEEYTFGTAYDVTGTVTHVGSLRLSASDTFPTGCCWGNNGQYFYAIGSSPDLVYRFETCSGGAYKILGRP